MSTLTSPTSTASSVASQAHGWAGMACVALLGVTAGVQMSDRGLQSILSPAIRQTFGVGDAVMGALHGSAGFLIAIALALPLARLADRHSRKRIQSLIHRAMLPWPIPWRGALPHPLAASFPTPHGHNPCSSRSSLTGSEDADEGRRPPGT